MNEVIPLHSLLLDWHLISHSLVNSGVVFSIIKRDLFSLACLKPVASLGSSAKGGGGGGFFFLLFNICFLFVGGDGFFCFTDSSDKLFYFFVRWYFHRILCQNCTLNGVI